MAPIDSFLNTNEGLSMQQDTCSQLYEQQNQDESEHQEFTADISAIASEASDSSHSYFNYTAHGLADSLTLIDCRRLLLELSDESELSEEFQEEDVITRIPSKNKSENSRRHGHNRRGVRRACNEDTQDTMYVYIAPMKME